MKKIIVLFAISILFATSFALIITKKTNQKAMANTDFLRIHIRANSNNEIDQNVKYKVKEKVVEYLSPLIINSQSIDEAVSITQSHIQRICEVANKVLKENGFSYKCKAEIREEEFPTRNYGNLTLKNGIYSALILELGSGEGNNWWCVMFPPLCFIAKNDNNSSIKYESKIWDIIEKYC